MAAPFTIGIEEEFQMVDRQTGQLCPRIHTILEKAHRILGEQIKAEMLQSMVEINSDIMPDIPTARQEMRILRAQLAQLLEEEDLALISAGTHPAALWQNECRSEYVRYAELEIEFRIFDMPATINDTLALAALCQALVAKLTWLNKNNLLAPMLSCHFIEENKWHAMRSGLDAEVIDFAQGRRLSMRDAIGELLDFVDEVVDDLGSRQEMYYLRNLLEDPRGTGADRQIALFQETGSVDALIQFLMQQTIQDIALEVA